MAWTSLDSISLSENHHPDAIEAIATVRAVLDALDARYLDRAEATVDADPDLRAATSAFRIGASTRSSSRCARAMATRI
jgi:hypothetical protein